MIVAGMLFSDRSHIYYEELKDEARDRNA